MVKIKYSIIMNKNVKKLNKTVGKKPFIAGLENLIKIIKQFSKTLDRQH